MNNKIVSTKRTSAIFLAIVLVTGTFALSSFTSSFMTEAQAQPYYGMDNNYEKSYGKDDKRDKSKDSSKSININKIKCINSNLNINGNNAGNVSIGNKGHGYLGTYSSDGSGSGYGGDDGYDKQGKGFECIINNNNTNNNVVTVGGGNVTDDGGNQTLSPCEVCFERLLNASELALVEVRLASGITLFYGPNQQITFNSLAELCEDLEFLAEEFGNAPNNPIPSVLNVVLIQIADLDLTSLEIAEIEECILEALGLEPRQS